MLESRPDEKTVRSFKCSLELCLQSAGTFRDIPGGSESVLVDPNLQAMLRIMAKYSSGLTFAEVNITVAHMYLASTASPEHCLQFYHRRLPYAQVVVGAEAKGTESSVQKCFPQLLAVCGSSAIDMHRFGLPREDCVVPGIAMAGSCCQFCAVYLLQDNFPVFVALSPVLSLSDSYKKQYAVAEWCLRLVAFATATADKLTSLSESAISVVPRLNMSGYFAKPVHMVGKVIIEKKPISVTKPLPSYHRRTFG